MISGVRVILSKEGNHEKKSLYPLQQKPVPPTSLCQEPILGTGFYFRDPQSFIPETDIVTDIVAEPVANSNEPVVDPVDNTNPKVSSESKFRQLEALISSLNPEEQEAHRDTFGTYLDKTNTIS